MRLFVPFAERKSHPEPVEIDAKKIVLTGTLIWVLVFIVLAALYPALADAGLQWWLHTAGVGILLGIVGLIMIRKR